MHVKLKRVCRMHLTQTFHLPGYRPGQKAAAYALLSGRDLLCLLPTGAGKSLCWQLPAVLHEGLTVVVSPLIALMRDQMMHLHALSIPAVSLDSLMSAKERAAAMEQVRQGAVRILFVSPERLETAAFRKLCMEVPPWLLVIDEAHCVVQWGQEFRPAYQRICTFAETLPRRPVLCAMTATADWQMQQQLCQTLGLIRPKRVILPILRENLHYHVRTTPDRNSAILREVAATAGKTVIFCRSRARTERLAAILQSAGYAAQRYHAGLERSERGAVQQRFLDGEVQILTATTAFGMGVDIPDIRLVIHDYLPGNVIDYVQQSGRAGRDGQPSKCLLLIDPTDLVRLNRHLQGLRAQTRRQPIRRYRAMQKEWKPVRQLLRVCLTARCIPEAIAASFGQKIAPCGCCSACQARPLLKSVPLLASMEPWQTRMWLLRWQRDAIAKKQGLRPGQVLAQSGLERAARTYTLPKDAPDAAADMQRLLDRLRENDVHSPSFSCEKPS